MEGPCPKMRATIHAMMQARMSRSEQQNSERPPSALACQRSLPDGPERGRGRDRLRIDPEVKDRRPAGFPSRIEGGRKVGRRFHRRTEAAERPRIGGEIRIP